MPKYITSITHTLWKFSIFLLILLLGCVNETEISSPFGRSETLVSFTVHVPGLQTPTMTKAGEIDYDLKIETIELIVFEKRIEAGVNDFYFKEIRSLSTGGFTQTDKEITFKSKLSDTSKEVSIMLVANARKLFVQNGEVLSWLDTEKTLEETRQKLIWENNGKWNIEETPIPMYGEAILSNGINISTTLEDISLTRMLARIDVTVADNVENFVLENIILVGHHSKGYIATLADDGTIHVPDNANTQWWEGFEYEYPAENTIYAFESNNGDSYLLLKGIYNGGESSWYRVNFTIPEEGSWQHPENKTIPVQRNYHYIFTIAEVYGNGYKTEDEAVKAPAVTNMKTDMLGLWGGEIYQKIVYDGRYWLGVETDNVILSPNYQDDSWGYVFPFFKSNYWENYLPDDWRWKAEIIEGTEWLQFGEWINGSLEDGGTVHYDSKWWPQFTLKRPLNPPAPGEVRVAVIRLTVTERLNLDITVTEKGTTETTDLNILLLNENGEELPYSLDNNNDKNYNLDFDLHTGESSVPAKRIYVASSGAEKVRILRNPTDWIPEISAGGDRATQITYSDPSNSLYPIPISIHESAGDAPAWDAQEALPFDIAPLPGEEDIDYWDKYTFYATTVGWSQEKKVFLKIYQGDWLVYSPDIDKRFYLGNMDYTLEIKSNTEWEITNIYEVTDDRIMVPQSPGSLITVKEEPGYMRTGALGTAGGREQRSTFLKMTTAEWQEGLSGYVYVEFKPANDHSQPPKTLRFCIFEHHQDYAPGNGITPMFYVFPINLPRTRSNGVEQSSFSTWEEANNVCKAIGEGWRLPSYTELCLIYAYRPALFNQEDYRDPYAASDFRMMEGWYYYHLWTLGTLDNGTTHATLQASHGYSYAEYFTEIMTRCVYTKWDSTTENPLFSPEKFPRSSNYYYPHVDNRSTDGPIIVSENEHGGVNSLAINTPPVDDTEIVEHARLAAKFQVDNEDINQWKEISPDKWELETYTQSQAMAACKAKGGNWRLPTQRELFLIFALGGTKAEYNDIRDFPGFAPLSEDQWNGNYKPLIEAYSYWTSTKMVDDGSSVWTFGISQGGGKGISPDISGLNDNTNVGGVRCVRTVN